jgi:hypothetical protein
MDEATQTSEAVGAQLAAILWSRGGPPTLNRQAASRASTGQGDSPIGRRTARSYSPACKVAGSARRMPETISLVCRRRLRANITQTSCFLRSCNPEIQNQFFGHLTNPYLCREEFVMDRLLKDVAREYYWRALVARDCAERSGCSQTRSDFLALEKLWIAQARRHDPNCTARGVE